MQSIEDQWTLSSSDDITSKFWDNIADAKKAIKTWILDRHESWAPAHHNDKKRLQLNCRSKSCDFHIRVAKRKDGFYGAITYTPHNCPPSTHSGFKERNSAWYLAGRIERDVAINHHIKPKEICQRAGLYHQLQRVPYMSAWRARERLHDVIYGNEGASFNLIPDWLLRVETAEADTANGYLHLEITDTGRFEALFMMFGAVRATLSCLRPFYALDGTHTRSRYNLTLLLAVGIDAEDRVHPLAFALVPIENEQWWSWFCTHLIDAFEDDLPSEYVIISDRDKGLLNAVQSKLLGAYHAMCCQHIAENIHKKYGRDHKATFWQIARAPCESSFNIAIQALRQDSPQVEEYLQSIGYETFAFARFPRPRFGHDTSNIVESVNSIWRDIRELPPLQLLNGIYQWTLTTIYERQREPLDTGNSVLSNAAYKQYKHRESIARGFTVLASSDNDFIVTTSRGIDYIVYLPLADLLQSNRLSDRLNALQDGSCSCGKYKDYQAPCSHAIACIIYLGKDPYDYFHPYYQWDVLKRTYALPLLPVTLQGLQPLEGDEEVLPPIKRTKRGRPKIARIRAKYNENTRIYHCTVCRQPGHDRRLCPNQPVEHGRAQRARDQLIIEGKY
jgi:hypothetical protein